MSAAPCQGCSNVEELADHRGRLLCYVCWHAAREAEPAWFIEHGRLPDHYWGGGGGAPMAFIREEADARVAALLADPVPYLNGAGWAVVPGHWGTGRVAHPGYLARRRAVVMALVGTEAYRVPGAVDAVVRGRSA